MNQVLRIVGSIAYNLLIPIFRIVSGRSERTRVLVLRDNKALLIKNIIGNGRWTLPGGGLHKAEKPVDGAARELHEETGLVLEKHRFIAAGVHNYEYRGIKFRYHLFIVHDDSTQRLNPQAREILSVKWVAQKDLKKMTVSPVVLNATTHWLS